MTLAVTVGSRLPAHATSKGRVLLAFLPEAELEAYFRRSAIERYTDRTVVNGDELRAILAEIRTEGWAIVDQQLEEGLCSVAAPILEPSGRVSAALSVCAHAGRVDPTTLRTEFLPLVLETARRVSGGLEPPLTHAGVAPWPSPRPVPSTDLGSIDRAAA